ncbi:MAG: type IV pilus assembly protein PilM [Candidatus Paceibacterota bacterium]|jgi:type IV pilus assembly protein PilM
MDNPFKKILDSVLTSLKSGGNEESVLGIDIGASSIKVVQLKRKGGRAVVETYGALSLGPYADVEIGKVTNLTAEKLSQALSDVIRESGVTTKSAALSIPSAASLIFLIELPSQVSEKEYVTVVPTEARKYIPVPISEVSLDWWAIPRHDGSIGDEGNPDTVSKNEVLVVAIHNDTLSKYRSIATTVDVTASFFEIEVFSSIRAVFGHELSPVLLVDFGASKTKLSIVEYGIVRAFHIVGRGSVDITNNLSKSLSISFDKAEEIKKEFGLLGSATDKNIAEIIKLSVDFILSETNNVVLNYEKRYNKTISKVILTGGGALMKGFHQAAKENFSAEVAMGNPFRKVEAPAFLEQVLDTIGPEFTVALGVALRKLQ